MRRRSFLASLAALFIAPKVVPSPSVGVFYTPDITWHDEIENFIPYRYTLIYVPYQRVGASVIEQEGQ